MSSTDKRATRQLRWQPLDNAAKIYPAARRKNWSNIYRFSVTLKEEIDVPVLQNALDVTVRRFPLIAVRLRRGAFWYYLQQLSEPPQIREENSYPLARMSREEVRKCALRVIVFKRRIAIEMFHSITDGTGALIFLKSLLAEYLEQKYGISVPFEFGVFDRLEEPAEEEFEDCFLKNAGSISASRKEKTAWQVHGTPEQAGFINQTGFELPVRAALDKAHEYGVSLTVFICAVMMQALQNMQKEVVPNRKRRKPIRVLLPVNLRPLFPSKTLRNFALYTTPEILPKLGEYSFAEICQVVKNHLGTEVTSKQMSMKIATNVNSERILFARVMPLFVKNIVMKAVYDSVGEKKSCLSLSNLGAVKVPEIMMPYIERMDVMLGPRATTPYNCGVLSFGDTLYITFVRNIKEPELEYHFHCVLRDLGIPVLVRSNGKE